MDLNRVTDAVRAYEKAMALNSSDSALRGKLKKAQLARNLSAKKCQQLQGQKALSACDAALLKGAPDEFAILQRKGDVLLAMAKKEDALRSYKRAMSVKPSDKGIQRKIASLTAPTEKAPVQPPKAVVAQKPAVEADKPPPKPAVRRAEKPQREAPKETPPAVATEKTPAGDAVVAARKPVVEPNKPPQRETPKETPPIVAAEKALVGEKVATARKSEVEPDKPPRHEILEDTPPAVKTEKTLVGDKVVAANDAVVAPVNTFAAVRENTRIERPQKTSFSNAPLSPGVTY